MNLIHLAGIKKFCMNNNRKAYVINGKGDFIVIMGPSGSGKTTLLNILGLLTEASEGAYFLEEKEVETISAKRRALYRNEKFGYLVQDFALMEEYSVYDNIILPVKYFRKRDSRKNLKSKVDILMKEYGIEGKLKDKVKELSVGQRQRVALCRALINDPEIILAD